MDDNEMTKMFKVIKHIASNGARNVQKAIRRIHRLQIKSNL